MISAMVMERRRTRAAEQPRQPDLPAGRRQQVHAADHEIDALIEVVDRDAN